MTALIRKIQNKTRATHHYYTLNNNLKERYESFLLRFFPRKHAEYRYKRVFNKRLDLSNPDTFSEKLIWLNLFWKHPLKTECGDKYTMRMYVEKLGYGDVLPQLLGVYNCASEIDFNTLPQKFVLKCTHGCGCNIICTNKDELNQEMARQQLDAWLKIDYSKSAGELHYAAMTPRIICEEFLDDLAGKQPTDFKVFCLNGKANCVFVATDRDAHGHTDKYDFYDLEWNKLPYYKSSLNAGRDYAKPASFDEIIKVAEILSKPFPFVRMDFYNIKGKAILGEMTFTPSGCMSNDFTDLAQQTFGSLLVLPEPV